MQTAYSNDAYCTNLTGNVLVSYWIHCVCLLQYIEEFLKSKADMLKEYFSLEISDSGHIISLPLLLDSFTPNLDRLPVFLLHLATEVS